MTVTAIVHIKAKPGGGAALRDAFIAGIPHARADADCQGVDILVDAENPDHIVLIETWTSVEAHGRYFQELQKTEGFAAIAALTAGPPDTHHYDAID